MTLRLLNGTLIDGTGAAPRPFDSITIRDGTIAAIEEPCRDPAPTDGAATTIDFAGAHLLPGLWDAHAHLGFMLPQTDLSRTPAHERPSDRTVRAGHAAMQALDHGVAALRIVGEADYVDVAWKRAFAEGMYVGPHMFVCGYALSATGGHGWQTGVSVQVDGVAEVRKAAREQMRQGADQVKLLVTGGVSSATETMHEPQMTFDEIAAAVEVARFKGRKVCAHIGGSLGAKMSIEAGVDCLEHGYDLDDEVIDLMVERGTYLVPTCCERTGGRSCQPINMCPGHLIRATTRRGRDLPRASPSTTVIRSRMPGETFERCPPTALTASGGITIDDRDTGQVPTPRRRSRCA